MKLKTKIKVVKNQEVVFTTGSLFRLPTDGGYWNYMFGTPNCRVYGLIAIDSGNAYTYSDNKDTKITPANAQGIFGGNFFGFEFFHPESKSWISTQKLKVIGDEFFLSEEKEEEKLDNVRFGVGTTISTEGEDYLISSILPNTIGLVKLSNGYCFNLIVVMNEDDLTWDDLKHLTDGNSFTFRLGGKDYKSQDLTN